MLEHTIRNQTLTLPGDSFLLHTQQYFNDNFFVLLLLLKNETLYFFLALSNYIL